MNTSDPITRLNAALEGRYGIERKLGEGGMASVYLADDIKHERKVALKVLKPELAAVVGAERFLAEIKTTANLQHPHILPLFDSGEADSFVFYVMPYVEGESLRERLDREHQLPVDDAVQIATNVAEALDYAHSHGVIHRDIKPANILLQAGKPVISDFGIALAVGAAGGGRLTETGLSLGTPHYMSPEQATGDQSVGPATDIYALGCVLYEMLVGEPPYTGSTAQAILGKIITGELATATKQRASVPSNVDAAIGKALERLPADRFTGAEDFARALADPGFRHGELAGVGSIDSSDLWKRVSMATMAIAVALAGIAVWSTLRVDPGQVRASERVVMTMTPPLGAEFDPNWGLVISPDERTIVFFDQQSRRLFRRDLGRAEAVPIPGTESAWKPFFSPDGESIGFFDDTENVLKRVRLDGTESQTLGPVPPTSRSAAWSEDGTIVFHSSGLGGLSRIGETGGDIQAIGSGVNWIDLLPGSEVVLGSRRGERLVVAVDLETGEEKVLFPGMTPRYVTGQVVYWREDALWAVPFDLERLEASGPATVVAQGVVGGGNDFAHFAVSENLLVYRPTLSGDVGDLPVWVDREGNQEALPGAEFRRYAWPRMSPDGLKVALTRDEQGNEDIWVSDVASGVSNRLTFDAARDWGAVWTPDGERIVFRSERDGPLNLYWRRADGTDEVERLTTSPNDQRAYGWTPDGSLLFTEEGDIWALPMEPRAEPVPLMREAYNETQPALAPNGKFLAYQSEELGYPEIFVRPFPELRGGWLVSSLDIAPFSGITNSDRRDGRSPVWSRDGDEIYYQSGYGLVRVPVNTEGAFTYGTPEILFEDFNVDTNGGPNYDVARDGRILKVGFGIESGETTSRDELVVVQNWMEAQTRAPN